jgi:hypothetical protein
MNNTELQQKLSLYEARLEVLEGFCQVQGPWLTPTQAAKLTPLSRRRCMSEIAIAEQNRKARKKTDLIYGVHYWNSLFPFDLIPEVGTIEDNGKAKNAWQIHYKKFWDVVSQPLENRNLSQ